MKRYEDLRLSPMKAYGYDMIQADCSRVTCKDEFKKVERGFSYIPFGENNEGYDKAKEFLNDIDKIKFDNEKDLFDDGDEWMTDKHGTYIEGCNKDQYQHVWINDQTCLLMHNFEDGTKITKAIYCYDPQGRLIYDRKLDNSGYMISSTEFRYDLKGRLDKVSSLSFLLNEHSLIDIIYDDNTFTSVSNEYINGEFDNAVLTQWDRYFDRKIYSYMIDQRDNKAITDITKYQYTADSEYTFSIQNPVSPLKYVKVEGEVK